MVPEQPGLRHAEAVDALLHVAHHEQVRAPVVMAQGLEKLVLRAVYVLAFVHEDMLEPVPPLRGDRSIRQDFQRQLLEIPEIDPA